MEAMKEVIEFLAEFIIESTKDFLTMILNLIINNVPEEILITAIIMTGTIIIIAMTIKLCTKKKTRRYRR